MSETTRDHWRVLASPSQTEVWGTPPEVFAKLDAEFRFTLDAAALPHNAKCARYLTPADDGLSASWAGETVWLNPPYGAALEHWVRKARIAAAYEGATVVCLVPARTGTSWWHDVALPYAEIRYLRGRLRFVHADGQARDAAPFACAVLVFRPPRPEDAP